MFMYQYRQEVERITDNLNKNEAWQYTTSLYRAGLINLIQWNNLNDHIKRIEKKGV